jgi:hypothetical protein
MSVFSPSSGNSSSAYPPTTGVAGSKQNMRVWIVSAIALSGTRATIKTRGSSLAQRSRRRSIQVEYDGIEIGGLPAKYAVFSCGPKGLNLPPARHAPAGGPSQVENKPQRLVNLLYLA